jgi:hypothetical protein
MPMGKKKLGIFSIFGRQKPAASDQSPLTPTPEPAVPTAFAAPSSASAVLKSHVGAVFQIALDGSPCEQVIVAQGMLAEPAKTGDGKTVLHLSGGDRNATSAGRTGGFSIRVPDSIEAAASGERVRVTVNARSARGAGPAEFSLAYSTNEVGNSGWRKFMVGQQFQPMSFEFDVPTMRSGNGDYVGILPAPGPGVEIETLKVEAIPRS